MATAAAGLVVERGRADDPCPVVVGRRSVVLAVGETVLEQERLTELSESGLDGTERGRVLGVWCFPFLLNPDVSPEKEKKLL